MTRAVVMLNLLRPCLSDLGQALALAYKARHEGAALSELLIELERSEWARQWFIERLRA